MGCRCIRIHERKEVELRQAENMRTGGDGNGTVILLELGTGMELRRYDMEAAVISATWHGGEFILGDLVGNLMGVDEFDVRWIKRMDIDLPFHDHSAPAATTSAHDCDDQLCSYVAVSLGRQELLLTHQGHVLATVPAPTRIACIWSSTSHEEKANDAASTLLCGGDDDG
ncbi:hypothetical protein DYB25_012044 [Aphanomyces astaci]|uniref:Uncharacterized protein n=1 Tax=Aphanomyces astaci TaxID=112090 RepID=A0A397ARF5_APHAT|nr:hypothetical protein DYB36_000902 [Aphanomyces astaci]RHY08855.1 hypothetical protein DYB25_012044 [Aphanomyces astaci]